MNTFNLKSLLVGICLSGLLAQAATIGWEAEDFVSAGGGGYTIELDVNALGGEYALRGSSGFSSPNSTAAYEITSASGGTGYNLYLRYLAADAADDSLYVPDALGSSPGFTRINPAVTGSTYSWRNLTADEGAPSYTLSAGTNSFVIGGRETERIDAFVLSTDDSLSDAALDAAVIPEPSTLALLYLAGLAVYVLSRRRI
jgi:hypothetical protein